MTILLWAFGWVTVDVTGGVVALLMTIAPCPEEETPCGAGPVCATADGLRRITTFWLPTPGEVLVRGAVPELRMRTVPGEEAEDVPDDAALMMTVPGAADEGDVGTPSATE